MHCVYQHVFGGLKCFLCAASQGNLLLQLVHWQNLLKCHDASLPAGEAYEHSELLLYKAMLLEEGDQLDEALSHLDASRVRTL